jgi:hypothetical protein
VSPVPVYRAPMRSRRDHVEPFAAVERALMVGLCGMGEALDERAVRRLERYAEVADGALVWTRDVDGLTYVGRLGGGHRRDDSAAAVAVDLVHVRDCEWRPGPVPDHELPPAVSRTFARGGRNFQQIHHPDVSRQSTDVWERQA